MRILFYLGHPAHYHLFKYTITELKKRGHQVDILIKDKDILETLLANSGFKYYNILPKGRKSTRVSIGTALLKRDFKMFQYTIKCKPDILLGTSTEITHVGRMINRPSILVHEDDFDNLGVFAYLGFPFAHFIVSPIGCRNGRWEYKTLHYSGYHELAYLHPNWFKPSRERIQHLLNTYERYFILRFSNFGAYHDFGIKGISNQLAMKIVKILSNYGKVYITSERELDPKLEKYRICINPLYIHDAIYYSDMYIGDSQTMAIESAVLGIPSIRFNDFAESYSVTVLDEIENKYGLTYGINRSKPNVLLQRINNILKTSNIKSKYRERRDRMLSEKIDVTSFFVWLIEQYPESIKIIKENPEYEKNFV